jgi:hypothetical protein
MMRVLADIPYFWEIIWDMQKIPCLLAQKETLREIKFVLKEIQVREKASTQEDDDLRRCCTARYACALACITCAQTLAPEKR